jgi:hypothetical protein
MPKQAAANSVTVDAIASAAELVSDATMPLISLIS